MLSPRYQALALLLGWNVFILAYRVQVTDTRFFLFFIWNLFLALVPLLSSDWAASLANRQLRWAALGCVLLSVLFLPNSPYIITDLFHLRSRKEMPLWYDTLVLFSLSLSGLLLYYATIFRLYDTIKLLWGRISAEITVLLLPFLCGFGIYLGRYLRFNSWDLVSNPDDLLGEILDRVIDPLGHARTTGVTLFYGLFLLVGYWVARLWSKNGEWRMENGEWRIII